MSEAAVEVCQINIGPKQRQRRMIMGVIGLAIAAIADGALLAFHVTPLARLGLALPLLIGFYGIFQAREKT